MTDDRYKRIVRPGDIWKIQDTWGEFQCPRATGRLGKCRKGRGAGLVSVPEARHKLTLNTLTPRHQ